MKKIILTGGGTAGHVTPNLALLPALRDEDFEIHYIGSYNGIERRLIEAASIPYDGISSGKLRRYFDLKNFSDPLRVLKGYFEARKLMKKYKPDIVFSKGGFVAVPVVLAAKHYKVPVIIHESDMTPGLANKICIPVASKVCCNFPETLKYLPEEEYAKLENLDVLVIDALRKGEHQSHESLEEALANISRIQPKEAYLIHMSHRIGLHAVVEKELPPHVHYSYDGLTVTF